MGGDAPDEPDDRVLGGRIDRLFRHGGQAGQRGGGDDPPAGGHHACEASYAQHDAVDVDGHRPAVALDRDLRRVGLAAEHAGVQARDLDRADGFPLVCIGDVEAGREVENLDVETLRPQAGDDAAPSPEAPPVTIAFT